MAGTLRPAADGGTWRPALRPMRHSDRRRTGMQTGVAARSRPPVAARWRAWAERLAGRWLATGISWTRMPAVLRTGATPSRGSPAAPHVVVHLAFPTTPTTGRVPAVVAVPVATSWPAAPAVTMRRERDSGPLRAGRPVAAAGIAAATPAGRVVGTTIARVLRQDVRVSRQQPTVSMRVLPARGPRGIEHTAAPDRFAVVERGSARTRPRASAMPTDAPWIEAGAAVPRVIVNQAAAPTTGRAQERTIAPLPPLPPRYWQDAVAEAPAPATVDLEHLTDQVIRAIDQRVIAARERLGRR